MGSFLTLVVWFLTLLPDVGVVGVGSSRWLDGMCFDQCGCTVVYDLDTE